ncbi:MAG: hypothetical protein ACD_75C00144G0008 [uncultured bacterium]|nr:MAG: hypothetical protein ACD_75C00144G0008 [uncultured bacterium]
MAEIEILQQQVEDLQNQLARQKKNNELLKKRTVQAILNGKRAEQEVSERGDCEAGRARAELASRVKSVFLENVSHEIRSSMNGIIGMTNLVLETELSPEQRLYLEMVSSSVDRLLVVVNEVLDFSRIETGELEIEPEDFSLKESLDHDLYVLNLAARKKDIDLTCTIEPDVPAFVHGDPNRLVQILTNLVHNGIKYTEKGGVAIKIENRGYDAKKTLLLRFSVTDTGCGIAPEKLELISHYFKQRTNSTVSMPLSVGTTGLGLTVSSQLVKLMGGEIGVESSSEGSTFWFVLPFKEVADISSFAEKANSTLENIAENVTYVLKGAKVLLAEDEHINRVLIETILTQLGVDVTSVDNGREAVKEACSGKYQLVLMDVQMEEMDGLEATRVIRKHERKQGGHLDIIALTAQAMPGDREKCLQAGMDDYLPKPLERNQLIEVLAKFLTRRALVVDGDPISQGVVIHTLIEAGWQVTIAETRRSAMYEASLSHFDLILLDVSTPQLESLKAAKILRQLEEYSGQRALILGVGEENGFAPLQECGFDAYLARPVTQEKILKQLEVYAKP